MTAESGLFLLIVALALALFQGAYLLPRPGLRAWIAPCLKLAAAMQALLAASAFAALMVLRIDSDFSVENVARHSNLSLPIIYKIAGTWGNHEGSMLLWLLVISTFGAILSASGRLDTQTKYLATATQALIAAGVLLFILFTSNPFARQFPPPMDGQALNPLLQDIGLAIHPPLLYVGYVGFSIVFSLAVAALLRGEAGRSWAQAAHGWIMASWGALTLGIGLGSWWAYRELGWGGWWFWDPVENASLLPWLAGTALLHSNIVLKKRGLLQSWVILLAILTFAMSMLGTFLVRSGALTSVHSFASDPARGLFILAYIAATVGGALLLYALRAPRLESQGEMLPASREGVIVVNNLFILTACATVLLGTVYPLLADGLFGTKLSVGAPYFNATFIPLMALPLLMAGLAPFMPWQHANPALAFRQSRHAWIAALAAGFITLALAKSDAALAALGFGLSMWLAASSVRWVAGRRSANTWPTFMGHMGVAVLVAGITSVSLWKEESERTMAPGERLSIGNHTLLFVEEKASRGDNYDARIGRFNVSDANGNSAGELFPEHRTYDIRNNGTSEAAIYSTPWSDIYAVLGDTALESGHTMVRVYYVPMVKFIWGGFLLIGLAGITSCVLHCRKRHEQSAL